MRTLPADLNPSERVRQQLEKENELLMQIVAQVRADLEKATASSPGL